jgi:hypothetical protein
VRAGADDGYVNIGAAASTMVAGDGAIHPTPGFALHLIDKQLRFPS